MKYYRVIVVIIISFSVCGMFTSFQESFTGLPITVNSRAADDNFQEPFNLVYQFYHALEENQWDKIKSMVTSEWWAEMYRSGYRQKWQRTVTEDKSVDFVMFLLANQKVNMEEGWGWVMGKVNWVSSKRKIDDENETVFFVLEQGKWKISSIRLNLPVEAVDAFYEAINEGDFMKLPDLLTEEYRELLNKAEILRALRNDWQKNRTGVYCLFFLRDFGVSPGTAWVKGDVLWNPLKKNQQETEVTISLVNRDGWKIKNIVGHWDIEK